MIDCVVFFLLDDSLSGAAVRQLGPYVSMATANQHLTDMQNNAVLFYCVTVFERLHISQHMTKPSPSSKLQTCPVCSLFSCFLHINKKYSDQTGQGAHLYHLFSFGFMTP